MRKNSPWFWAWIATLAGVEFALVADEPKSSPASVPTNGPVVELRGKLLPGKDHVAVVPRFKTESGDVYTLESNQLASALFVETNLVGKTLLLKGRAWPGTTHFAVTGNLRSLREGKVHELYYYCDICAIKTSYAGPCMCCREPVRLMEAPVGEEP